jgi:glycosyltransferase involved in cell wall biosynthesis
MSNRLVVKAAVYGPSGYSELSRNLILGLYKRGIDIKLESNIYEIHDVVEEPNLSILNSMENKNFPNDIIPPKLSIGIAPWFDTKYKGYKVGYTMFEFDNLPNIGKYNWYDSCINMDEIWVPSTYNYKMLKNNGIQNVNVLPVGIDIGKFKIEKNREKLRKIEKKEVVFLSVGEFNYRKGWDILLKSFVEEFNSDDNIKLIIKSFEHDKLENTYKNKIISKVEEYKSIKINPPKIEVIVDIIDSDKMPHIYQNADIFIMATLGEGFGLPMAEAMACGIPCILPNNSAYLDFVNGKNGWLVEIDGYKKDKEISKVAISYFDSEVPNINIDHFKKCMREAYQDKKKIEEKGKASIEEICSNFNFEDTIDNIYEKVIKLPELKAIKKSSFLDSFDELEIDNENCNDIGIRGLKGDNINNNEEYSLKFVNNILKIKDEIEEEIESLDENNLKLRRELMKKRKSVSRIIKKPQ